jgi:hypothetical protein
MSVELPMNVCIWRSFSVSIVGFDLVVSANLNLVIAAATKVILASLDDRTLQDLGLRRIDIEGVITDMGQRLTDASAVPFTP